MSLHGPAMSLHGPAVSLHGPAVSLHGPAVSLHGPAVSLHGPAVSLHGPAMSFSILLGSVDRKYDTKVDVSNYSLMSVDLVSHLGCSFSSDHLLLCGNCAGSIPDFMHGAGPLTLTSGDCAGSIPDFMHEAGPSLTSGVYSIPDFISSCKGWAH